MINLKMRLRDSASAENFGNFFAQNCFMGSSGTLLIVSTLNEQGFDKVDALKIAMWSIPVAVCAVVISTIYFVLSDVKFDKKYGKGGKK